MAIYNVFSGAFFLEMLWFYFLIFRFMKCKDMQQYFEVQFFKCPSFQFGKNVLAASMMINLKGAQLGETK